MNSRKLLVRKGGFEPPRSCDRQPLKLVRLPFRHFRGKVDQPNWLVRSDENAFKLSRLSVSDFTTLDNKQPKTVND